MFRRRRGTIILLIGIIGLTYVLYINTVSKPHPSFSVEMINHVTNLKLQIQKSDNTIKRMQETISRLESKKLGRHGASSDEIEQRPQVKLSHRGDLSQSSYDLEIFSPGEGVCSLADAPSPQTDIQMFNVLDTISFVDKDGGVWKQGFDIKYSDSEWSAEKPLKVFVIPHSHDDPGWLKTFDGYYNSQVQHILDNMVTKLGQHTKMKFIYAEISYFSKWWSQASDAQRDSVKQYIKEGRFELVTGGWVMPDEAASHYWALVDQLIEGHAWIRDNIGEGIVPRSGWSIDPFGHTSTMAYILQNSGIKNMLVQRIHYSIKKYFAENKFLEFNWRQTWDKEGSTDILCHMMPFYSYDVPHTCGPDPKICCQFDFNRLPGGKVSCPWRVPPQAITSSNVHERAWTLLDQYRKKSQLYRSNVVLIPLGDDFRYDNGAEWDKQYTNYQALFEHMNSQSDWNVQAQFGTLSDYFRELRKEISGVAEFSQSRLPSLPTLSGDFYTYADRADHYWSGYFTSRPFYKHWDRHLETTLRSAEIIFSLAQAQAAKLGKTDFPAEQLYADLTYSRQSLGLFQHHDGITGTAKTAVNNDYGQRMLDGWKRAYKVISRSAQLLLQKTQYQENIEVLNMDWIKDKQDSLEVKTKNVLLKTGSIKKFVIYNSSPQEREEIVRVWVQPAAVSVYDSEAKAVICQISPYFTDKTEYSKSTVKLSFLARVPALGLATYTIEATERDQCAVSQVSYYNTNRAPPADGYDLFNAEDAGPDSIDISNNQISVSIDSSTGTIQTIADKKNTNTAYKLEVSFIKYKSDTARDHAGGAYLFFPKGDTQPLSEGLPLVRVIKGNLFHEVQSFIGVVQHTIRVDNLPGAASLGVEITNVDLLSTMDNTEIAMQFSTDIENTDTSWYTDLNGYTMHKRKYQRKIQLQGNVYPVTSLTYIEDTNTRLNVLTAQSAGVISTKPGNLQVFLDRRLNQDDNRGLGEAIKDSKRTESKFFVYFEKRTNDQANSKPMGYPSTTASVLSRHFVSPLITLSVNSGLESKLPAAEYQPLNKPWPCELYLMNLRALKVEQSGDTSSLLLVHHQSTDCGLASRGLNCVTNNGELMLTDIFKDINVKAYERRTLTNLENIAEDKSSKIHIDPMNIVAYKLTLH